MTPDRYRFGAFELRLRSRELLHAGVRCGLGGRAFDVLVTLLENADRVVGRAELLERAWPGLAVEPNNLQVQVCALRKLLGAGAIVTVARRGYRYTGPAVKAADDRAGVRAPLTVAMPPVATPAGESARRQLRWQSRPR
jgi:DNA-binding winged helix-turn-helix (wHTH) protein